MYNNCSMFLLLLTAIARLHMKSSENIIPVINISSYRLKKLNDEIHMNELLSKFYESISTLGFLYLSGHGLEEIETMILETSQQIFSQNQEGKNKILSKDRAKRGYAPFGGENYGSLVGEKMPNDLVEKYRVGPPTVDLEDSYYHAKEGKMHFYPNSFGDLTTEVVNNIIEYYNKIDQLSIIILELIALSMKIPVDFFTSKMNKHTSILTFNHFPHVTNEELLNYPNNQLRIAAHTDVSMITIVSQSYCQNGHLEIMLPNEEWIRVPYIPGAFIVNIGDCLSYWTGNVLKSTLHRVTLPKMQEVKEVKEVIAMMSPMDVNNTNNYNYATNPNNDICLDDANNIFKEINPKIEDILCVHASNSNSNSNSDGQHELPNERYSIAYFVTPNYTSTLVNPLNITSPSPITTYVCNRDGDGATTNNDRTSCSCKESCVDGNLNHLLSSSEGITYTKWRKERIQHVMQILKSK